MDLTPEAARSGAAKADSSAARRQRVLLIDDDRELCALLEEYLAQEGFDVVGLHEGTNALAVLDRESFQAVILDIMMPGPSGLDVLRALRPRFTIPILMLTARGDDVDRIVGLEMGADDYLSKPFEVPELLARIEALRRRSARNGRSSTSLCEFGDVSVNFDKRSVLRAGQPIALSRREFQMLSHLIRNQGRVVFRDELLRSVWGYRILPYTRTVDVHMWQLRRKLEADPQHPRFLRTFRGIGYLFSAE